MFKKISRVLLALIVSLSCFMIRSYASNSFLGLRSSDLRKKYGQPYSIESNEEAEVNYIYIFLDEERIDIYSINDEGIIFIVTTSYVFKDVNRLKFMFEGTKNLADQIMDFLVADNIEYSKIGKKGDWGWIMYATKDIHLMTLKGSSEMVMIQYRSPPSK